MAGTSRHSLCGWLELCGAVFLLLGGLALLAAVVVPLKVEWIGFGTSLAYFLPAAFGSAVWAIWCYALSAILENQRGLQRQLAAPVRHRQQSAEPSRRTTETMSTSPDEDAAMEFLN